MHALLLTGVAPAAAAATPLPSLPDPPILPPFGLPLPLPLPRMRPNPPPERIQAAKPKAIILSGGPNSVHLEGAPRVPDGFFEYCQEQGIAVMGICYGMQVGAG